jgi:acyl carrier protein
MEVKLNELNDIFNKAFETTITINMDSVRDDFGAWDSINHLNLIVELEDFYHVNFSMDEIKEMFSVKKIVDILAKK